MLKHSSYNYITYLIVYSLNGHWRIR